MENGPFIDEFPIRTSIYKGFSMAMLNNQRVSILYFQDFKAELVSKQFAVRRMVSPKDVPGWAIHSDQKPIKIPLIYTLLKR